MSELFEILIIIGLGYLVLLLLLETVIWKVQPDMEGVVVLHIPMGDGTMKRKLYGLRYDNQLYVASNHWFRRWYYAVLDNPVLEVEYAGEVGPHAAVAIGGEEQRRVAQEYNQGMALKIACGFAPQRFLRLDRVAG